MRNGSGHLTLCYEAGYAKVLRQMDSVGVDWLVLVSVWASMPDRVSFSSVLSQCRLVKAGVEVLLIALECESEP